MGVKFDTKIAVVLADNLETWQKLNVTAFLVSGIAGTVDGIIGEAYEDASGVKYLPMIIQPMLVFSSSRDKLRTVYERALRREVRFSVFTQDLFATGDDVSNRAAVRAKTSDELDVVGVAFRTDGKIADKILKGVSLHK